MIVTDGLLLHQDSMGEEISKEYVLYRDEEFELLLLANESFKRAHLDNFFLPAFDDDVTDHRRPRYACQVRPYGVEIGRPVEITAFMKRDDQFKVNREGIVRPNNPPTNLEHWWVTFAGKLQHQSAFATYEQEFAGVHISFALWNATTTSWRIANTLQVDYPSRVYAFLDERAILSRICRYRRCHSDIIFNELEVTEPEASLEKRQTCRRVRQTRPDSREASCH